MVCAMVFQCSVQNRRESVANPLMVTTPNQDTLVRGFHAEIDPCGLGFSKMVGHVSGEGTVGGKGGGEGVESCSECADMCSAAARCLSYECTPTEVCVHVYEWICVCCHGRGICQSI